VAAARLREAESDRDAHRRIQVIMTASHSHADQAVYTAQMGLDIVCEQCRIQQSNDSEQL
jgi:hypothetical protein